MTALTELLAALVEFLEAEARSARRRTMKVGAGFFLFKASWLLAVAAIGLMLWALFLGLVGPFGTVGAALFTGGVALLGAGVLSGIGVWVNR